MYSWLQIASNDKIIDCCYVNVCYCITLNRISTSQCVLILFLRHTCFWFRINNETNVQHFIYRKNLGYFIQPIFKISSHIFLYFILCQTTTTFKYYFSKYGCFAWTDWMTIDQIMRGPKGQRDSFKSVSMKNDFRL